MTVVKAFPPNYAEIRERLNPPPRTVFAYGGTIYSPGGTNLPADLLAHEMTHFAQQARSGGPEAWWRRYIDDPEFRLVQEVEAYRAQYKFVSSMARPYRRKLLAHICASLASPMYGRLVTKEQARTLIAGASA